jgi:hypothetical protein
MMHNPEWSGLLTMYWHDVWWAKTAKGIRDAAGEIRHNYSSNPPDNEEMCDVLRWMAGPECKQNKGPTLKQLMIGIAMWRKKNHLSGFDDEPLDEGEQCGLCHDTALVGVVPSLPATGWTYDAWSLAVHVTVPCKCGKGLKAADFIFQNAGQEKRDRFAALSATGLRRCANWVSLRSSTEQNWQWRWLMREA